MSGSWFWLALLPQSVNNDLAAAVAGCCCQAFDKHSPRSRITLQRPAFIGSLRSAELIPKPILCHRSIITWLHVSVTELQLLSGYPVFLFMSIIMGEMCLCFWYKTPILNSSCVPAVLQFKNNDF